MTTPSSRSSRWDVYGDPDLETQLAKAVGPHWDALRTLVATLEWRAEAVGRSLSYPWPPEFRRAAIRDEKRVYGAIEYYLESRAMRVARILSVVWLPGVD